jgi:hypothetical protein
MDRPIHQRGTAKNLHLCYATGSFEGPENELAIDVDDNKSVELLPTHPAPGQGQRILQLARFFWGCCDINIE